MIRLHHFSICPFSRKVRIALREKGLAVELVAEEPWQRTPDLVALNPACEVPVLVDGEDVIADSYAICEYLDEAYTDTMLFGEDRSDRAEVRRLVAWFDVKFAREVTDLLWREKLVKRLKGAGTPNSQAMRAGNANIRGHLDYIAYLFERRNWLAGDAISLADITAAAHLSVLDYLGDVPWEGHAEARDWYARIKSRPSFRPLLADRISGVKPPVHYDDLDF